MAAEYKVVLLGANRVGKSSLIVRFVENYFMTEDFQTIEDLFTKMLKIDGELCLLDILDTCGIEKFGQIKQEHISYGQGFVLVFAAGNKKSFEDIEMIRTQVCRAKKCANVPIILVANKMDLSNHEVEIDLKQVEQYAERHNMIYVETSAKTGQGVEYVFQTLIREIRSKKQIKAAGDMCTIL